MKKFITYLSIFCISTVSLVHAYVHTEEYKRPEHSHHALNVSYHVHADDYNVSAETHEHLPEEVHNHLDQVYRRIDRESYGYFVPLLAIISDGHFFNDPDYKLANFQWYNYNSPNYSPDTFRNLPLLIHQLQFSYSS